MYGANFNRLMIELAQISAFANFIRHQPSDLGNWISNPSVATPLPREAYDRAIETQLGLRIAETLNIDEDWWQ